MLIGLQRHHSGIKSVLSVGFHFVLSFPFFCTGFRPMMTRRSRKVLSPPPPPAPTKILPETPTRPTVSHLQDSLSHAVPVTPPPDTPPPPQFCDLQVAPEELRPSVVLTTGQCFHWTRISSQEEDEEEDTKRKESAWGTHNATEWIGILRVAKNELPLIVILQETPSTVLFRTLSTPTREWTNDTTADALRAYFQLDVVSIVDLYSEWSTQCDRLRRIAAAIPGLRMVEQDPFECLVSFLCSSNNNIPRITQMLQNIRREYGTAVMQFKGEVLYSFPSLETLKAKATEKDLRSKCRMGYRAKYLMKTVEILSELGGEDYLRALRDCEREDIVSKLLQFSGVGRKVADCVALCSLRSVNAVPVDVHVWNIARRDYGMGAEDTSSLSSSANRSLTPKLYQQVGERLQQQFPRYSGWAHALLFAAELPSFRERLPADMVQEMESFRDEEKSKKRKAGQGDSQQNDFVP